MNFEYSKRTILFSMVSPIEYDIKKYLKDKISLSEISEELIVYACTKAKIDRDQICIEGVLNQLTLSQYVKLVNDVNDKTNDLVTFNSILEKLVPIRNRVCHPKQLHVDDLDVCSKIFSSDIHKIELIDWIQTRQALNKYDKQDYTMMLEVKYSKSFVDKVDNNLPEPEYEDSGFIGRNKEKQEILKLINSKKWNIVSIVGAGGTGKTATLLSSLYDYIETEDCEYDRVIWTTLKTSKMTNGDFEEITNVLASMDGIIEQVSRFDKTVSTVFNFVNVLGQKPTLLVIDNLETLVIDELFLSFLKAIPESCKVIITSRDGIGQLDYVYDFPQMNVDDSVKLYNALAKYFRTRTLLVYNDTSKKQDIERLHFNPLSIKYYIINVASGGNPNTILHNQKELLSFCMKNVYEKLSHNSKLLLKIMQTEQQPLTRGELLYFSNLDNIQADLNHLITTYMVKFKDNKYHINKMTLKYLTSISTPEPSFFNEIKSKRNKLYGLRTNLQINVSSDPYNPLSFRCNFDDPEEIISGFYLSQIFKCDFRGSNNEEVVNSLFQKAENIKPDFFEIYKIKAFVYSQKNPFIANEYYRTSLSNTRTTVEKAYVLYFYASFQILSGDTFMALENIESAKNELGNTYEIQILMAKIHMINGNFKVAEELLDGLEKDNRHNIKNKAYFIYLKQRANLERRRSQSLDGRDIEGKVSCLIKGVNYIEQVDKLDKQLLYELTTLVRELCNFLNSETALDKLDQILSKYSLQMRKDNRYYSIQNKLTSKNYFLSQDTIDRFSKHFKIEVTKPKNSHNSVSLATGVISLLKYDYGFILTEDGQEIYFKFNDAYLGCCVGDKVAFTVITYKNEQKRCIKINKL